MTQAIEDGLGIVCILMAPRNGSTGLWLMAIFEEIAPRCFGGRGGDPIIDNQERDTGERFEQARVSAIAASASKVGRAR